MLAATTMASAPTNPYISAALYLQTTGALSGRERNGDLRREIERVSRDVESLRMQIRRRRRDKEEQERRRAAAQQHGTAFGA